MRSYRDTMEDLRFSPEEKAAMTQALLQAAASAPAKTKRRKKAALIAVAAVAAALCAACATGVLQDAMVALSARFGSQPEQVQTLQQITHPVLAQDTDNGVTVSVEAVLGDQTRGFLLCRMEREDGQPVLPQNEDTKNVSNGDNTLLFDQATLIGRHPVGDKGATAPYSIDMGMSPEFLDFAVDDHTLYFFFDLFLYTEDFPRGDVTFTLENLYSHEYYETCTPSSVITTPPVDRIIPLVDGTWTFSFTLDWQDPSTELEAGQVFHLKTYNDIPIEGTIQSLRLSPITLSLEYTYTVAPEDLDTLKKSYDPSYSTWLPLDSWLRAELAETRMDEVSYLTLTDGRQIMFHDLGHSAIDALVDNQISISLPFQEAIPLDTIESVTIGDLTIPMP